MKNPDFAKKFGALWSTNMGMGLVRIAETIGRELTVDDVELHNWAQSEFAKHFTAVDYAQALAANVTFRRAVQQWWAGTDDQPGFDLLVSPTLAEPPTRIGEFANDPDAPMAPMVRAGRYVAFTPAFNSSGQPAISLPLHWTPDGPAGRRAARRRLRPRGRAGAGGEPARAGTPVDRPPPTDLITGSAMRRLSSHDRRQRAVQPPSTMTL